MLWGGKIRLSTFKLMDGLALSPKVHDFIADLHDVRKADLLQAV